jgi:hypothetical protein
MLITKSKSNIKSASLGQYLLTGQHKIAARKVISYRYGVSKLFYCLLILNVNGLVYDKKQEQYCSYDCVAGAVNSIELMFAFVHESDGHTKQINCVEQ